MQICFLDFEFNSSRERDVNLVSVAYSIMDASDVMFMNMIQSKKTFSEIWSDTIWLHEEEVFKERARETFKSLVDEGAIFVAYAAEAEIRSLIALFGDEKFTDRIKVIDLYLEYRCLLNHNHHFQYGEQYKDGKIRITKAPKSKYETAGEDDDNSKPSYSLAAATFKLLDGHPQIDTEEKDQVRRLIYEDGWQENVPANKERILRYNASDIQYLPRLLKRIRQLFVEYYGIEDWRTHALTRGEYAVATAKMVRLGYPINRDKVECFTRNIDKIYNAAIQDVINTPLIVGPDPLSPFRRDKKTGKWVCSTKNIQAWVQEQKNSGKVTYWRETDGGKLSIAEDAFKDWFDSQTEGFPGAYCRYLKTKKSLNGFMPGGKKGRFNDYVGGDARVRPYFGIYGSQSSRSQPGSVGFIPLKAHWMRNFIDPRPGRALAGIDYASQEFLIAAVLSQDGKMMAAYASGDPYLAFGKDAGLLPQDATKKTHAAMREVLKAVVLGVSYDMTGNGLAPRLSRLSGETWTKEKADHLIEKFFDTYCEYALWKDEQAKQYYEKKQFSVLPDGWTMFLDNKNRRSVGNFPIQGHGAVIMREAVKMAQKKRLQIIFTLHDAIYLEYESYKTWEIFALMQIMQDAFTTVMQRYGKTIPIRLEGESWSPDYLERMPDPMDGIEFMSEYVDEKGRADLERYRKFFT